MCRLTGPNLRPKMGRMPGPRSTFALADRALDGRLRDLLLDWRAEGLSYTTIAKRLLMEHELDVSTSTVVRWISDLTTAEAAS